MLTKFEIGYSHAAGVGSPEYIAVSENPHYDRHAHEEALEGWQDQRLKRDMALLEHRAESERLAGNA